jgi:hypothetical protein
MIWILGALLVLVAGIVVASFLLIKFVFFAILALYPLFPKVCNYAVT